MHEYLANWLKPSVTALKKARALPPNFEEMPEVIESHGRHQGGRQVGCHQLAVRQQIGIEDVKAQRKKSSVTTVEFVTPPQHV